MRFALLAFSAGEGDCCLFACGAMGRKEGLLRAISGFCPFGRGAPDGAAFGVFACAALIVCAGLVLVCLPTAFGFFPDLGSWAFLDLFACGVGLSLI
jgi:hypothetical protein